MRKGTFAPFLLFDARVLFDRTLALDFDIADNELALVNELTTQRADFLGRDTERACDYACDLRFVANGVKDIFLDRKVGFLLFGEGVFALVVARVEFGDFSRCESDFVFADVAVDNGVKELTISHNRPLSPTLCSGHIIFSLVFSLDCTYIISLYLVFVNTFYKNNSGKFRRYTSKIRREGKGELFIRLFLSH